MRGHGSNPYENGEAMRVANRPTVNRPSTLLGVGGRLGAGWGPTHPTDPRKRGTRRRSPYGRGEMDAPLHRAAPSIPHTQQNGAVLAVRSGADDPRLQRPEMRPTSGGGSTPQKIYMYKYAERGAICGRRSFVRHARRGHDAREQIDDSRRLFDARRNVHRPQMRRPMPRSGRPFQNGIA